jgi:hypothetical protein
MAEPSSILDFERFWRWLVIHHNCIVRAGTDNAWLYDQDDLHWHLYEDVDGRRGVQLMRGKHVLGEFVLEGGEPGYVEAAPSTEAEGQSEFQVLGGDQGQVHLVCHFVLAHGYDEETGSPSTH